MTGVLVPEFLDHMFDTGVPMDRPSLAADPLGAGASIEDDLAALQRTTARQVRASLRRVFGEELPAAALAARPAAGLRAIAAELRAAHDRLIAPHWSRIRAVLDADVIYRAKQLAAGGAERLFTGLHPDLHWCDGRLMLQEARWRTERVVNRGPGGLVLMPVVLGSIRVRRALVIMASASGAPPQLVAAADDTVREVIHAFNARGLEAPDLRWAGGRPRLISDDDVEFIAQTALTRPEKLGRFTHWSIRKPAAYLAGNPVRTVAVGRERLRQLLRVREISFQRTRTWKESTDPAREAELDRTGPRRSPAVPWTDVSLSTSSGHCRSGAAAAAAGPGRAGPVDVRAAERRRLVAEHRRIMRLTWSCMEAGGGRGTRGDDRGLKV
ncbi:helix-turn-helix domain-containing protein [Streptosporangium minutum]|uniref:helix-turn-helix domain-containing protein n=1 Tax=Streptosporangium minutum TaxID=569862 RepID=UPI001A9984B1|nr:helix-turn-helix domain-containing protein [Streptosporangium minutum]